MFFFWVVINTYSDDDNNNNNNNDSNNNNNNSDILQRYQQSIAPSERIYQSTGTLDDALKTPWALHYEVERRAATPNFPSNSVDGKPKESKIHKVFCDWKWIEFIHLSFDYISHDNHKGFDRQTKAKE